MNPVSEKNKACTACEMRKECAGPVPAEGAISAKIALIGEAPGRNEDRTGRPWMGPAGHFLDALLRMVDILREDVWLTNMAKCRPKSNRTPTPEEASFCAHLWLDTELGFVRPKVIGLLGDTAIRYFLGEGTVYERHGKPVQIFDNRTEEYGPWLLPMYHPAAGLYDKGEGMLQRIMNDWKVLGELVRGTWVPKMDEYPEIHYGDVSVGVSDSYMEAQPWEWDKGGALDTEWVDGKLWSVQISLDPGSGFFFPTKSRTVKLTAPVTVHNYMADGKYIDLPEGSKDTMVMAYLLGLPQGLKELAKTYAGMEMDSYQDMTRKFGHDKAMAYLETAALGPDGKGEELTELQKRDLGMARAVGAASDEWKSYVKELIQYFANTGEVFSSNNINEELKRYGLSTDHKRAMGSLFSGAGKRKVITKIGSEVCDIAGGNSGLVNTWRGI